jgi:EpsI family protein
MTARRDMLIGIACLLGVGLAYGLTPHRRLSLLVPGETIDQTVPKAFGDWISRDVADLVAAKLQDDLANRLYGEIVGRIYTQSRSGIEIMMLLAYGDTQSNDLQLHRPEICYPAFGFSITKNAPVDIDLGGGVLLPSRRLVADAPDRRETIIYWSRLGEYLPLDRKEQQLDRLRTAMTGVVADGILARFSILGPDVSAGEAALTEFIPGLVRAVHADRRRVLVGSRRAAALAAIHG